MTRIAAQRWLILALLLATGLALLSPWDGSHAALWLMAVFFGRHM